MLFITMLYNMYINDADKQITMYWACNVTKSSVCALLGFSLLFFYEKLPSIISGPTKTVVNHRTRSCRWLTNQMTVVNSYLI